MALAPQQQHEQVANLRIVLDNQHLTFAVKSGVGFVIDRGPRLRLWHGLGLGHWNLDGEDGALALP